MTEKYFLPMNQLQAQILVILLAHVKELRALHITPGTVSKADQ